MLKSTDSKPVGALLVDYRPLIVRYSPTYTCPHWLYDDYRIREAMIRVGIRRIIQSIMATGLSEFDIDMRLTVEIIEYLLMDDFGVIPESSVLGNSESAENFLCLIEEIGVAAMNITDAALSRYRLKYQKPFYYLESWVDDFTGLVIPHQEAL